MVKNDRFKFLVAWKKADGTAKHRLYNTKDEADRAYLMLVCAGISKVAQPLLYDTKSGNKYKTDEVFVDRSGPRLKLRKNKTTASTSPLPDSDDRWSNDFIEDCRRRAKLGNHLRSVPKQISLL
jgi:hypothetical protein